MVQVLEKDFDLFVSKRSSKVLFTVLKQLLEVIMLVKEKGSIKSYR